MRIAPADGLNNGKLRTKAFEDYVWTLDLSDCQVLEKGLLALEAYELLEIVQKRIDNRMGRILEGFGFPDE